MFSVFRTVALQKILFEACPELIPTPAQIIIDRAFNTAKLLDVYLGRGSLPLDNITWNPMTPIDSRCSSQVSGASSVIESRKSLLSVSLCTN